MAAELKRSYNVKELHVPGEPWSLVELENIPHLHSRAQAIRKVLHANKTFRDIQLQNKQDYENFAALCNRDLIFYLKVTHQYYLLSNLFKDPKINKKWAHFIDRIRYREYRRRHRLEHAYVFKLKASTATTNEELRSLFAWSHPDPSLSNLEKLVHYERELARITIAYHNTRANLYNRATNENIDDIDNVIGLMERHHGITQHQINRAREAREQLVSRQQQVYTAYAQQVEGNADAGNEYVTAVQEVYQYSNTVLNSILSSDYLRGDQLDQLVMKLTGREQRAIRQDNAINRVFSQQKSGLIASISNVLDNTKKDNISMLQSIIDKLQAIDFTQLTPVQKDILNYSVDKLQNLKQGIADAKGSSGFHEPLTQCADIIKNIYQNIPKTLYNSFETDTQAIAKVIAISKPKYISNQNPNTTDISPLSVNAVHLQSTSLVEPSAPPQEKSIGTNSSESSATLPVADGDTDTTDFVPPAMNEGRTMPEPDAPPMEASEGRTMPEPSAPPIEASEGRTISEPSTPPYETSEGMTLHEPSAPEPDAREGVALPEPSAPFLEGEPDPMDLAPGNVANGEASTSANVASSINVTKYMRLSLFGHKEKEGTSEQQDLAIDKDAINKILSVISKKMEATKNNEILSPDDILIAERLISVINQVKFNRNCPKYLEKIQEISDKANELSRNYDFLKDLETRADRLSKCLSQAVEQRSSLNM